MIDEDRTTCKRCEHRCDRCCLLTGDIVADFSLTPVYFRVACAEHPCTPPETN